MQTQIDRLWWWKEGGEEKGGGGKKSFAWGEKFEVQMVVGTRCVFPKVVPWKKKEEKKYWKLHTIKLGEGEREREEKNSN